MKSLKDYIVEYSQTGKLQFSDNELMEDYKKASIADTLDEKKVLMSKYNVNSRKKKNIQDTILLLMRDNRQHKQQFNEDDVRYFYRLDIPTQQKKLESYLDEEPVTFIRYLRDYEYDRIKMNKLDRYLGEDMRLNEDLKNIRVSLADSMLLQRFSSVNDYINKRYKNYEDKAV